MGAASVLGTARQARQRLLPVCRLGALFLGQGSVELEHRIEDGRRTLSIIGSGSGDFSLQFSPILRFGEKRWGRAVDGPLAFESIGM